MPEALLDSGSEFDRCKALLWRWLRDNVGVAGVLVRDKLATYKDHLFVAGWAIELEQDAELLCLDVLVDGQFPYSPIRVALTSWDAYLKWPHVEPGGLLCLPGMSASADIEGAISTTLLNSLALVEQCQDPKFVSDEFRREFLSYWNRSAHDGAKRVRSLLDLNDQSARRIAVWYGESYTLVSETPDQARLWLENRGRTKPSVIVSGIYGFLDLAPVLPFPERPGELYAMLHEHCPGAINALETLPVNEDAVVVLGASSPTGMGLIAMKLSAPNLDGFRKHKAYPSNVKRCLWKSRSKLKRLEVERFDPAWVHGRGMNKQQPTLQAAAVLVLGCGSLGSQVAERLAQCGVGSLTLVDPDSLAIANVGRHALGVDSVGAFKATKIAADLRARFPHMCHIEGRTVSWQNLYADNPQIFADADLIVACLGEWSADGQLGEWQMRLLVNRPVVYGWLDEYGTASHAIALAGASPALSCILSPYGDLRLPETLWKNGGLVQSEPACGTLFQPYGAIDVAHAEALVSRLCIDVLTGTAVAPVHRVYAGPTAQITEAGGEWSTEHLKNRPKDFDGAFEYERSVSACGVCPTCVDVA